MSAPIDDPRRSAGVAPKGSLRSPTPVAALLTVVLLSGCGGLQRSEDLMTAVQTYNENVRWERFPAAAGKLMPPERAAFLDERDALAKDLRITEYEVIGIRPDRRATHAAVQIKYTWFLDSRGVVHETHAMQDWERHGKVWILASEHRMRGDEMPGLVEPEPADGAGDHSHDRDPGDTPDAAAGGAGAVDDAAGSADPDVVGDRG